MPQSSLYYTDLQLPTLKADNSTYGTILINYFQGLETKLKDLSDRITAAGVGSSSTLAQINRDIAQTNTNTSSILPDPYSGDYSTVSTWPAFNTELTALGLSPPETASEIETFFSSGDFTTFANFLNGKLDALDIIVTQAESDLSSALEDTCATATILDARTAAISAGTSELATISSGSLSTELTSAPYSIGGGFDESIHKIRNSSQYALVQGWLDDGTLLDDNYRTFWGYRASDSYTLSILSIGDEQFRLSFTRSGDDRSLNNVADVQLAYDGPATVGSTSRIIARMPQIGGKSNFFGLANGSFDSLRFATRLKRYPYPTLNCSNPSPPYFT